MLQRLGFASQVRRFVFRSMITYLRINKHDDDAL